MAPTLFPPGGVETFEGQLTSRILDGSAFSARAEKAPRS